MSTRIAFASAAVLLTAAVAFPQESPDAAAKKPELTVWSPAPALAIEKWVKGSPVAGFEKGKTYVVEFWATWCGPCIAGMPHLSELQRQYRDKNVTIIGVSSEDPRNPLTAVEAMVKDKADGMDYTVAWDDGRKTSDAFMKAAQQRGIPCCFVVDGTGTIAYIGHPMFLDMPLAQLAAGTWDIEKGNAAIAEAKTKLNGVYAAFQNEPKSASAKIAEFETQYPALVSVVAALKFDAYLFAGEYEKASTYGGKRVDEAIAHKNPSELNATSFAFCTVSRTKRSSSVSNACPSKACVEVDPKMPPRAGKVSRCHTGSPLSLKSEQLRLRH